MAYYKVTKKQSGGTQFADLMALASAGSAANPEIFDLTDSVIHTQATKVPQYMFYYNRNVGHINLANVTEIGDYSFFNGRNVKSVNLPSCTSIGTGSFEAIHQDVASPMTMINIPNCVNIADYGFRNMRTNTNASTPIVFDLHSMKYLGQRVFQTTNSAYTWYTEEIDMPDIIIIGQYCFGGNTIGTLKLGSLCATLEANILYNTTCTNLIINRSTPPTLTNTLGNAPAHIYVPSDAVETYKAASVWSNYASIIESIPV